jgi:hypothetical protein
MSTERQSRPVFAECHTNISCRSATKLPSRGKNRYSRPGATALARIMLQSSGAGHGLSNVAYAASISPGRPLEVGWTPNGERCPHQNHVRGASAGNTFLIGETAGILITVMLCYLVRLDLHMRQACLTVPIVQMWHEGSVVHVDYERTTAIIVGCVIPVIVRFVGEQFRCQVRLCRRAPRAQKALDRSHYGAK